MKKSGPFTHFLTWLKITSSALICGTALGSIVFCYMQNIAGIIIGIAIALFSMIAGMVLASKIRKRGQRILH
jgi:hypothetical protein